MSEKDSEPCCSKMLSEINNNVESPNKRKIQDENEERNKRMKSSEISTQLKKCKRLLYDFRTRKNHLAYTANFLNPVDVELFECPDYYDVIKNPMDLHTMKQKMDRGEYSTPEEFASDIRLIISNCCTYNAPDHDIIPICEKFKTEFETRFEKIMKAPQPIELQLFSSTDLSIRRSSRSFTQITLPDDEDSLLKEIQSTKEYLNKLYNKLDSVLWQKQAEQMQNRVPSTRKRNNNKKKASKNTNKKRRNRKDTDENDTSKIKTELEDAEKVIPHHLSSDSEDLYEPMTYDEKRELVLNVAKLPTDELEIVCDMVRKMDPESSETGEDRRKINFARCSTETLRAIQKFVHEYFHPKAPRAAPLPRKEKLEKDNNLVMELKQNLEAEKEECEKKIAKIENQLGGAIRRTVPEVKPPTPQLSSSSSTSSSSGSSSSSSGSDSTSSSDSENN